MTKNVVTRASERFQNFVYISPLQQRNKEEPVKKRGNALFWFSVCLFCCFLFSRDVFLFVDISGEAVELTLSRETKRLKPSKSVSMSCNPRFTWLTRARKRRAERVARLGGKGFGQTREMGGRLRENFGKCPCSQSCILNPES